MSDVIPYISQDILIDNFKPKCSYYWSHNFSPGFYINLAKKGFISTSNFYEEYGDILLPEMQEAYAVLHFENLHISKNVKKLLNRGFEVIINQDINSFLPLLKKHHGDECWFTKSYIVLTFNLLKYTIEEENFRLNTVFLKKDDKITAGEIGYFIGNTYTSLTGFYDRDFNNHGTLQLVLLAKELKKRKLKFWNLGHPYMDYKIKLGAKVLQMEKFLDIWEPETTGLDIG
jgi:Leu/Phe-tRNA-protein transferase